MPRFTDRKGRVWTFELTVSALRRIRSSCVGSDGKPFDALSLIDEPERALRLSFDDPILLSDVLYACVRPEAVREAIDRDAFGELLDGETLVGGLEALLEGVVSFCRTPELRRALGWLPTAVSLGVTEAERTRATKTQSPSPAAIEHGDSSGAVPGLSELTLPS